MRWAEPTCSREKCVFWEVSISHACMQNTQLYRYYEDCESVIKVVFVPKVP